MALFAKLEQAIKGAVGAVLAPAADPRIAYADASRQHDALLVQVRRAVGQLDDARSRLRRGVANLQDGLALLEEQARRAVAAGQEDLARLILERRRLALGELDQLGGQLREIDAEQQRLLVVEQRLTAQIQVARSRLEVAALKYTASQAQVRAGEALTGVSGEWDALGRTVAAAEERAEYLEARAAAIDGLIQRGALDLPGTFAGPGRDPLAGAPDDAIERELERLRREATDNPA